MDRTSSQTPRSSAAVYQVDPDAMSVHQMPSRQHSRLARGTLIDG